MTGTGNMGWGPTSVQSGQGTVHGQGCAPYHSQNGPTPQQLSVVATVWGVTTTNQSGPLSHNYPGAGPGQQQHQQSQHQQQQHQAASGMLTSNANYNVVSSTGTHSHLNYVPPNGNSMVPHKTHTFHQSSSQGLATTGKQTGYGGYVSDFIALFIPFCVFSSFFSPFFLLLFSLLI